MCQCMLAAPVADGSHNCLLKPQACYGCPRGCALVVSTFSGEYGADGCDFLDSDRSRLVIARSEALQVSCNLLPCVNHQLVPLLLLLK